MTISRISVSEDNTKLAEFVVRFLHLSALVATELGREAVEDRGSVDGGRDDDPLRFSSTRPASSLHRILSQILASSPSTR